METNSEIFPNRQNQSSHKVQFSPLCETNSPAFGKTAQGWIWLPLISPPLSKKIPTLSVFCISGITGKKFLNPWVFLGAHLWDSLFYILQLYFKLKFFHTWKHITKFLLGNNWIHEERTPKKFIQIMMLLHY